MRGPDERVVLLERERELRAIDELLDDARQRSGQAVLFQGEAGTGKTELVAAARRQATECGLRCLFARGGELERQFAFGVVRQLFERAVVEAPEDERSELFAGAARVTRGLFKSAEAANGEGVPTSAGALLHGLYWLAANLAEREPLLIAVDDLHWSDEASIQFLAYLVRRIEGLPIAVVAGARPAEPGVDLGALEPLQGEPLVDVIAVGGLSEEATAELLTEHLEGVTPAFVHVCHAATRGNPFLVRELGAHMAVRGLRPTEVEALRLEALGPPSVGRTVAARVERLPDPAPALARAVAALGAGAEVRHAAELAETTVGDATAAADDLAAIGVLAPGRPLEFVHPLVRAALHANLPAGERARSHARAAGILAEDGAVLERVAAHLLLTEPGDAHAGLRAVDVLTNAAEGAIARGYPEAASRYLKRALLEQLPGLRRATLLLDLGKAEFASGAPQATDHFAQALELMTAPADRARAAMALARSLVWGNRIPEAVGILESARDELSDEEAELRRLIDADLVTCALLHPETLDVRHRHLAAFRPSVPSGHTPGERLLLVQLAVDSAQRGEDVVETEELAMRALADGALLKEEGGDSLQLTCAARCLAVAERFADAHGVLSDGLRLAQRSGSSYAYAACSMFRCETNYRRGELLEAEADGVMGLEVMKEVGSPWGELVALVFLVPCLLERGKLEEAVELLYSAGMTGELPPEFVFSGVARSRGLVRAAQGRTADALADLLDCGRREQAWREPNPAVVPWRSDAALAHAQLRKHGEARRLASEELELARCYGAPRAIGIALRALGLVEEASGDPDMAREHLREAVAVLERSEARLERARALTDLGAALRRTGHRVRGREFLRRGLDLADRCGAPVLVGRARTELLVAGGRPRRRRLSGAEALTPSERRVAEMAAGECSNRKIAQDLFVTVKTVEGHLGRAYGKLGIGSRVELKRALGEEAKAPPT